MKLDPPFELSLLEKQRLVVHVDIIIFIKPISIYLIFHIVRQSESDRRERWVGRAIIFCNNDKSI